MHCCRSLQRHVADTYLAPDVKLTHMLGDVEGREALYGVYRAAVSGGGGGGGCVGGGVPPCGWLQPPIGG
jgi:hypothetical protein